MPLFARLPRTAWALVAANAVPLAGVFLLGWDLGAILVLFWAENVVVGGYHALRLGFVAGWLGLLLVPFFLVHFGLFTLAHAFFVFGVFAPGPPASLLPVIVPGVLALVASHGASFVLNFLRGGERQRMRGALAMFRFRKTGPRTWEADLAESIVASPEQVRGLQDLASLMSAPYRRLLVLHVTIIAGAWLLLIVGSPAPALAFLVVVKTVLDVRAHVRERARLGEEAPQASSGIL